MIFAILKNEFDDSYKNWIIACEKNNVHYALIDLTSFDWLGKVKSKHFDCFLACPSGREDLFKKMYDERIYIIERVLNKFVYPNYNELSIHENKKYLSYWLKAKEIPHPETFVFYNLVEALRKIRNEDLPLVGKTSIGASGKGVTIFRDRDLLEKYVQKAIKEGIRGSWGPNLKMGNFRKRVFNVLKNPKYLFKRLIVYRKQFNELQKGYVIIQRFVPHQYEWRIVKIGDSYFGHQKIKQKDKASGTKGINYVLPPLELLDFVRDLCLKNNFNSMAVDLFEDGKGGYLVNELQTIFGHVQDYICAKEDKPGRFLYKNNSWIFEEGNFNTNLSYDLRLHNALNIIRKK